MDRRHLLGSIVGLAGGSLTISTGAFSSTRAERTISTEVVDDSKAYLRIAPEETGIAGRSSEVNLGDGGKVAVFRIPGPEDDLVAETDPEGIGKNSEYWFNNMAVIQNKGTDPITVYSQYSGPLDQVAIFDSSNEDQICTSPTSGIKLDVGGSFRMGLYLSTGDQATGNYNEHLGIVGERFEE